MNRFVDIASAGVRGLHPYQPGKPIEELQREYQIEHVVKLASNENPLGPSPNISEVLAENFSELARYPDGNGYILKQALAQHLKVNAEQITLGNGSNDILELVARAFAAPGDEIIYSQYAFAVYPLVTQAINASAVVVPAKQWGHDLEAMAKAVTDKTKIVFIANPNNPTGTWVDAQALEQFIQAVPKRVIIVVDEAYFEYASDSRLGASGYPDAMAWLSKFENLVVTRTFSKAYGLAAMRVGYSVSHPDLADLLNRVRQPFNVNHLALVAASTALADPDYVDYSVAVNAEGMQQLTSAFKDMGLEYIPSVGNFVCVKVAVNGNDSQTVYERLLRQGVIVRPVANYQMPEFLRVSVGVAQENVVFINALAGALK